MVTDHQQFLPSPWLEFLAELDSMLTEPVVLHCIGGFVVCFFYGLARSTADIDYYTAVPANLNLDEVAGEGSALGKKHKVWLHRVAVTSLPEDYETRLTEMVPGHFKNLKLLVQVRAQQFERSRRCRLLIQEEKTHFSTATGKI